MDSLIAADPSARAASLIELSGATRVYRLGDVSLTALTSIDLTVAEGEFVAVWGPSGSGKSTLLNLIGLVDAPTAGSVRIEGQDVSSLDDDQLSEIRNQKIGFVFQNFNLVPVLSALENVMLPLHVMGVDAKAAGQRARSMLEEIGLGNHLAHRPDKLSGGQQQRVAIARALVTRPRLVIADEPTANLDSVTARAIVDLMLELNSSHGVTFIFSTHDQRLLEKVKRKIHLEDGSLVPGPEP